MAKQIKAIECPKCGSTEKTEIKPDYFRCNNCNTEYFLDNDDVTINQNIHHTNDNFKNTAAPSSIRKIVWIVVGVCAVFTLLFVIPMFFISKPNVDEFSVGESGGGNWWGEKISFYATADDNPVMVQVGDLSGKGNIETATISFYDLLNNKKLKQESLPVTSNKSGNDYEIRHFKNGEVYIIVNKQHIFKVNKKDATAEDITSTTFATHPEMSSGIADAKFLMEEYGDGIELKNNENTTYFYYPIIDKLYTKDENTELMDKLDIKVPGENLVTNYRFTGESLDYPERGIQLIQYQRKDSENGPGNYYNFYWTKDAFTGDELYNPSLKMIRSWKDFTPQRKYLNPDLLYFDDNVVIFTFSNTPADDGPRSLQCLDAKTAEVKWTLPGADKYMGIVVTYKNGVMADNGKSIWLINNEGKIINDFKNK